MELVYPWDDSKFRGSPYQLETVYGNLRRLRFPVDKMKNTPSSEKVTKPVEMIMEDLFAKKWVLALSNSTVLMQALALLCPVVFSLTTGDSSALVSTAKLIERFKSKDNDDLEPRDDLIVQARGAGLVCWESVSDVHESGSRYHSQMSMILMKRKSIERPTVFLATFVPSSKDFTADSSEAVLVKIGSALGDTAAVLIQESMVVRFFEVEQPPVEVTVIKV